MNGSSNQQIDNLNSSKTSKLSQDDDKDVLIKSDRDEIPEQNNSLTITDLIETTSQKEDAYKTKSIYSGGQDSGINDPTQTPMNAISTQSQNTTQQ